jgi:hypothetical protein
MERGLEHNEDKNLVRNKRQVHKPFCITRKDGSYLGVNVIVPKDL